MNGWSLDGGGVRKQSLVHGGAIFSPKLAVCASLRIKQENDGGDGHHESMSMTGHRVHKVLLKDKCH